MRILIIDDHPLTREGLKALLSGLDENVESTGIGSVADALALARAELRFDLVLLDMQLPGLAGVDALRSVLDAFPEARVVVVSAQENSRLIHASIDLGADGYIPKTTDNALTIQALRLVLAGGIYLPTHTLRQQATTPDGGVPGPDFASLSARQAQVLRCMADGKSNKMIARELDIAEGTVKTHLSAIFQCLNVKTRAQAMRAVLLAGWPEASR